MFLNISAFTAVHKRIWLPAGVTFVIVKNDALGKVSRYIPTMLNYQTHVDGGSMFNTPPVLPIYAALQTLRWIKANGGVAEMQKRAKEKKPKCCMRKLTVTSCSVVQ